MLVLVLGAAWYVMRGFATPSSSQQASASAANAEASSSAMADAPLAPPRQPPPGDNAYRNERFRFELFYAQDLKMKEFDEGGGAMTITFENKQTVQGFQIFAVPFGDAQITEERFRKDEPSGVRNDMRSITIDGAPGASFYSKSANLGDTAEVWFIHGGYLFEVTTPKVEAKWLSDVMTSWRWI
jgi:hypothetical protein